MIRVHILCEGLTEQNFAREMLWSHFWSMGINVTTSVINKNNGGKGGVSSYKKLKREIKGKCKSDSGAMVTTLLDLYGIPRDFPGIETTGNIEHKAGAIKRAFSKDIDQRNFLANVIVHEFECLLFSDPAAFGEWFDRKTVRELIAIRGGFSTPEHINEGQATAPSKRIMAVCKGYRKTAHGNPIALTIGLDRIRQECPLFDGWISGIEKLKRGRQT